MQNQTEKLRHLLQSLPLSEELKDFWLAALPLLNKEEIQTLLATLQEASEELTAIK